MNELYKDKGQAPGGMGAEKQPDLSITPYMKTNYKWTEDLNVKN